MVEATPEVPGSGRRSLRALALSGTQPGRPLTTRQFARLFQETVKKAGITAGWYHLR